VSFRGDSESEWPSTADKLAVTTTASKADEDDELKGQCHQNNNPIQRKASEINSLLFVYTIMCLVFLLYQWETVIQLYFLKPYYYSRETIPLKGMDNEEEEELEGRRLPTPSSEGSTSGLTGGGGGEIWLVDGAGGRKLSCTNQHRRRRRHSSSVFRMAQSFSIVNLIETTREVLV
jgi:hypothetical protein